MIEIREEWRYLKVYQKDPGDGGRARMISLCDLIDKNFADYSTIRFLEVGVLFGDVAEHLLASYPRLTYWGVDLWEEQPAEEYPDTVNNGELLSTARSIACARTERFSDRREFVQGKSPEVLRRVYSELHQVFDMVYIDANHTTEAVYNDIMASSSMMREKSIICGHDYCPGWESVKDGVERAAEELGKEIVSLWPRSSVWYFE